MEIALIRHADAVGAGHGYFGRTETPLSPLGRGQATRLGAFLAAFAPDSIWLSPSLRARATLELALPRPAQPALSTPARPARPELSTPARPAPPLPLSRPDLREVDFGRWEGKTFEEIAAADPDKISAWAALKPDFAFPGGESLRDFEARIHRVADRIRAAACSRLVIVTHGGIIRYILADLLRLPSGRVWIFALPPGSVTSLRLQDGYAQITGLTKNEDLPVI